MAIKSFEINVKDFGAQGTGTVNDGPAFLRAITYIWNNYTTALNIPAGGDNNRRAMWKIIVPAGTYRIDDAESLMPRTFSATPMFGITFEGAGEYSTQIYFTPSSVDSFLLYNNSCFLFVKFKDIAFTANDLVNANFMYSLSSGGGQHYKFENVSWSGKWKYGLKLHGTNTNSEMAWYHCKIGGSWDTFFYIPTDASTSAEPRNADQFVNYHFYGTDFEVSQGNFINAQYGGSINVIGGSLMITGTNGGTLFTLGHNNHFGGAQRFLCQGTRMEFLNANCKMIYSEWGVGTITFMNVDNSSQQSLAATTPGTTDVVNAIFAPGNESGASVQFIGCTLQGKHEYRFTQNQFTHATRVTYIGTEIWHYRSPHQFIVTTNSDGIFNAGAPNIRFENCRGKPEDGQVAYIWDGTLNWDKNRTGHAMKRIIKLSNPWNAGLPGVNTTQTIDAWLPLGAIITNVTFYMKPGTVGSTSAGWKWFVKTSEATPTTLHTGIPVGDNPNAGMNTSMEMFFLCDSDAKRHIVLTQSGVGGDGPSPAYCLVEFIS